MLKDIVEFNHGRDTFCFSALKMGCPAKWMWQDLIQFEGVFAPLQERARFIEVRVHPELGTIYWPNSADLDPDVLYARITDTPIPDFGIKATGA